MSSTQEAGDLFGSGIGPAHAMLRSPTVVIAAVGLWGMNLYFFRVFGIDYIKILKYDLLRIDGGLSEDSIHRYLKKDLDHNGLSSGDYTGTVSTSGGEPPSLDEAVDGNASGMAGAAGNSHTMNSSSNNNSNNLTNIHSGNSLGIDLENDDFVVMDTLDRPPGAITWYRLVALSFTLLFLLHFTYFLWIDRMKGDRSEPYWRFTRWWHSLSLYPYPPWIGCGERRSWSYNGDLSYSIRAVLHWSIRKAHHGRSPLWMSSTPMRCVL